MIVYRDLKEADITALHSFLKRNNISVTSMSESFRHAIILLIKDEIKGFASSVLKENNLFEMKCLYLDDDIRGQQYGDGLIKAFLNLADQRGIKTVMASDDVAPLSFFRHLNFAIDKNNLAIATLPTYFDAPCKQGTK